MREDAEGFISPFLDDALCVNCGLCKEVCPVLEPVKHEAPHVAKAAWINDDRARFASSSGGLSVALATAVLEQGGVVAGAAMDNFKVHHVLIEDQGELFRIQGSKYVQSELGDIFQQIKDILDTGRLVLFTGTPCQVAGLQKFLRREYPNLVTIDVICYGVPSPKVLQKYSEELRQRYYTATSLTTRDKVNLWNPFHALSLYDKNKKIVFREIGLFSPYINGFISNIFNRLSCSNCRFTSAERVADITLGDFWAIEKFNGALNDKKGTSLVLLSTEKGARFFEKIRSALATCEDVPLDFALAVQPRLREPAKCSPLREAFFAWMNGNGSISDFLEKKQWKVGILNFHFADNFGAVLVAFSLSKVVEKLGYSPEIINYIGIRNQLDPNFEIFRQKYLSRSRLLASKAELEAISPWWKRIIVGSDQVWHMMDTGIYMLNWAAGQKNLISYAASFGQDHYSGSISRQEASMLLHRFDSISVREASGVDICEKEFGIPAIQVLDPTLLLDESDYVKIIDDEHPAIPEGKYICLIVLNGENRKRIIINKNIFPAKETGKYQVVDALFHNGKFRTVGGWLELIRKAEYVITDSFHGTVFSIIFKKQFVSIVAKGVNGQARIPSLLETLHIDKRRMSSSFADIPCGCFEEQINYDEVYKYLDVERERSLSFLRIALEKPTSPKEYFYKIATPMMPY